MKIFYTLIFISLFCFADWESDIASIKTDIATIKSNVTNLNNNDLDDLDKWQVFNSVVYDLAIGVYDYSSTAQNPEANNITFQWPGDYNNLMSEYSNYKDNTNTYDTYIKDFLRNNNTVDYTRFTNTFGESFIQYGTTAKLFNSLESKVTDLNNNQEMMRNDTNVIVHSEAIVNKASERVLGFLNTSYEDFTFFTLDLSGLGYIFGSSTDAETGVVTPNSRFTDWKWKINMVPDETKNPLLYKWWVRYRSFYITYHGAIIILICAYIYTVVMFWHKLESVFSVE